MADSDNDVCPGDGDVLEIDYDASLVYPTWVKETSKSFWQNPGGIRRYEPGKIELYFAANQKELHVSGRDVLKYWQRENKLIARYVLSLHVALELVEQKKVPVAWVGLSVVFWGTVVSDQVYKLFVPVVDYPLPDGPPYIGWRPVDSTTFGKEEPTACYY
jgi:hypothetical protein